MRRKAVVLMAMLLTLVMSLGSAMALSPFEIFQASTLDQIIKRNKLIVGMEVEFFPFEYADEKGNPIGFDVDIARLAAKELGVEIEIKDIEWTGLIPSLQSGKVDMIISGMTATLERAKAVTFSRPYFETGLCALLSQKKAPTIKDARELNAEDRIIAVKVGTTGDLVTARLFPNAQINRYKDETACVREVVTGRADAFLYDQLSVAKHHKQNPETTRALLTPFTYEPYAIAMRKGDFDFWNWINMYLDTIKRDGRYQELYDKYFSEILQ
ncbi:transporter substrate-binding domain-containing protein [Desulfoferrobacter suflitae]|uniref:transporter substrate-binding domain-containing protein n=1 Tax=Desulfoferrobacter suflitae TaxID=2865782 RepID=UPI002164BD7D|nr:transporter substrate-binding domain-containing protein [Desulfoferrobacter suflitae]MCK8603882.1 transporter substrate-binding domain-containing protein [Desulfoferrobacter suflitae]